MHALQIVVLVVILGILAYIAFIALSIQHAASITRVLLKETTAYTQHPSNPTAHILVAGDSTAVGVGAGDSKLSIAGRLGTEYPTADIQNVAVSGAKLADLTATLSKQPIDAHYDLLLIQIGANDIVGFTPSAKIRSELDMVLAFAQTHASHTVILTAGDVGGVPFFYWPLNVIFSYRSYLVRNIFMTEIATYPNVSYVDLVEDTKNLELNKNVPLYYAPDHFHPSAATYEIWFNYLKPKLPQDL